MNEVNKKWVLLVLGLFGLIFLFYLAYSVGTASAGEAYLIGYSHAVGSEGLCVDRFGGAFIDDECLYMVAYIEEGYQPHKFDIHCEFINLTAIVAEDRPRFNVYSNDIKDIKINIETFFYQIGMEGMTGCEYGQMQPISGEQYNRYAVAYLEAK